MNTATLNIPLSYFEECFKFKTPQLDISSGNIHQNTEFAVDISLWNDGFDISFSNLTVTDGEIGNIDDPKIKEDVIRHIAKDIWELPIMASLFGNKSELLSNVSSMDTSFNSILRQRLVESGGSPSSPKTDFSNNIVYDSLITILNSSYSSRITDLFTSSRDITQWISIPFSVGDIIQFNINYDPTFNNNFNSNDIDDRSYLVKIHLT